MVSYPRILFPLDLSGVAPLIARHVEAMASKFSSQLHVLHVLPSYDGPSFPSYDQVMDELRQSATVKLDQFISEHLGSLGQITTRVKVGHTGRTILRYVEEHDISLVIMGTHGRSGLGHLFFGSVAQRVVQNSKVPVLTVHPGSPA